MKLWRIVGALGFLAVSLNAQAQTDGTGKGTFGSPDIYNTGKTGSKTLPPEDSKTPASGAGVNPVKSSLQDIYNRCVAATKKRDESVLAALRTQDFTYRDAKGKAYARGDIEASERQTLANAIAITKVSSQVEDVKAENGKTTATLHHYFAETVNDTQNKPRKMTMTTTSQEVWTSTANVWKLQSVKVLSQQETLDGKPYDPSAPSSNKNNNNNGNRQARNNSGYRAATYHAPHNRKFKFRTIGGVINP